MYSWWMFSYSSYCLLFGAPACCVSFHRRVSLLFLRWTIREREWFSLILDIDIFIFLRISLAKIRCLSTHTIALKRSTILHLDIWYIYAYIIVKRRRKISGILTWVFANTLIDWWLPESPRGSSNFDNRADMYMAWLFSDNN